MGAYRPHLGSRKNRLDKPDINVFVNWWDVCMYHWHLDYPSRGCLEKTIWKWVAEQKSLRSRGLDDRCGPSPIVSTRLCLHWSTTASLHFHLFWCSLLWLVCSVQWLLVVLLFVCWVIWNKKTLSKLGYSVGLQTWMWRHIVTSQTVYPVTMTNIRHCSILELGRVAYNQAVAPVITRPLHATELE